MLAGCGGGISTNTDWDQSTDFSAFSTYSWFDARSTGANDINSGRIRQAVDSQLAAKGLRKVSSGGDLAVSYQVSSQERSSYSTMSTGWGGGYGMMGPTMGMGMGSSTTTQTTWQEGTLVLGMFDGATRKQLWHGTATTDLDQNSSPDDRTRTINEAVSKMLEDFPSGG
ncbi:MAG: DUF4136 domain-containing protein [Gemmatimonadetes bacterium]|nr:DUF4136 domain-containing protein [Gemmatimonadota bacterium]